MSPTPPTTLSSTVIIKSKPFKTFDTMSEQEIERGKELLKEFYETRQICNEMEDTAAAYNEMKLAAENLVDYITDIIYNE